MNSFLVFASIFAAVFTFEFTARQFIKNSYDSSGELFGIRLPPYKAVATGTTPILDSNTLAKPELLGAQLTLGDTRGILQEDEISGYAVTPSTASKNGWWKSNNIAARADKDTMSKVPANSTRVLFFGDSFAHGSRVPQDFTITHAMEARNVNREVLNFGIDGYSMGQAFLNFKRVRPLIDFNHVVFLFVPQADLWRDINVLRYLGRKWKTYIINPRFVLVNNRLTYVKPLFGKATDIYQNNFPNLSPLVREHLVKYDRFYFPTLYEDLPIIGSLITGKLLAKLYGERQRQNLDEDSFSDLNSEAHQVSRAIFNEAQNLAANASASFSLAILPNKIDLDAAETTPAFRENWQAMISTYQQRGRNCIDLLPWLLQNKKVIDYSYDGYHYGQNTNRLIARFLDDKIFPQALSIAPGENKSRL